MKKLNALVITGIIALGSATVGQAQIHMGAQETGFSGALIDNETRTWNISGYYGYFFTEQLQFLGIGTLRGQSGAQETGDIGVGADWHFTGAGAETFVPYAGASFLFGIGSGVHDTLEGHVGIKQFLAQSMAVKYQIGYGVDPTDTGDSQFRGSVGLSFFF